MVGKVGLFARLALRGEAEAESVAHSLGRGGAVCVRLGRSAGPLVAVGDKDAGETLEESCRAVDIFAETPEGRVYEAELLAAWRGKRQERTGNEVGVKASESGQGYSCQVHILHFAQDVESTQRAVTELVEKVVRALEERRGILLKGAHCWDRIYFCNSKQRTLTFTSKEERSCGWQERAEVVAARSKAHEQETQDKLLPLFRDELSLTGPLWTVRGKQQALRSPHVSLLKDVLQGGLQVVAIRGNFDFYHYGVDGFDDRGWGCAYRCLQMVASWFLLTALSASPVPCIPAIQTQLVSMGVMDSKFQLGCKQWIGSQEVSWVLASLVPGLVCRFLFAQGREIPALARDLQEHFESDCSPIICCGGSLALTLLGVAWDRESGGTRFLIADPHYTGADVLSTVIDRPTTLEGFRACAVSWRSAQATFHPSAAYTMLLPLLPSRENV